MIKNFKIFEKTDYHNLHGDDDYNITKTERDNNHEYQYCDGILYELSNGDDKVAYVSEISHTEENTFYQDQIERYVEYFEDGGITQTFPVTESKLASNLEEMLEYLDESDNFDMAYDLLMPHHEKLFDMNKWEIISSPWDYGFGDNELTEIHTTTDLIKYYSTDDEFYDEDLMCGFKDIIEYFEDNVEYSLTDFNHRFAALKEMGKTRVMVEVE